MQPQCLCCGLTGLLTCRLMSMDLKDERWKGGNVFSSAIKEINLLIDMMWVLVSWHLDCCPIYLHFVVKAKPKSSSTSGTKPTVCAVISASILTIYMSTVMALGYVSPEAMSLLCCLTPNNYYEDDTVYMRAVALLALNLGYGLFYIENIGQSWHLCECLRPFIIANHVNHPQGFCFQIDRLTYLMPPSSSSTSSTFQTIVRWLLSLTVCPELFCSIGTG